MKTLPIFATRSWFWRWLTGVFLGLQMMLASGVHAVISAGGLAVIGYDDSDGAQSFTVAALEPIAAGEVVYFTNNGWSNALNGFYSTDATNGAGAESLLKLTITAPMAKGTVFASNITGANYMWTNSGAVPGTTDGLAQFSDLMLNYHSDQIYVFQGLPNLPLMNPTNFLYAIHFGDAANPTFSDSTDMFRGAIPPGLSLADHTAMEMADLLAHGDSKGFHSSWGLNMDSPLVAAMQTSSGHIDQWLALIADGSNWSQSQPVVAHLSVAPEPARVTLLLIGTMGAILRRRRTRV